MIGSEECSEHALLDGGDGCGALERRQDICRPDVSPGVRASSQLQAVVTDERRGCAPGVRSRREDLPKACEQADSLSEPASVAGRGGGARESPQEFCIEKRLHKIPWRHNVDRVRGRELLRAFLELTLEEEAVRDTPPE